MDKQDGKDEGKRLVGRLLPFNNPAIREFPGGLSPRSVLIREICGHFSPLKDDQAFCLGFWPTVLRISSRRTTWRTDLMPDSLMPNS